MKLLATADFAWSGAEQTRLVRGDVRVDVLPRKAADKQAIERGTAARTRSVVGSNGNNNNGKFLTMDARRGVAIAEDLRESRQAWGDEGGARAREVYIGAGRRRQPAARDAKVRSVASRRPRLQGAARLPGVLLVFSRRGLSPKTSSSRAKPVCCAWPSAVAATEVMHQAAELPQHWLPAPRPCPPPALHAARAGLRERDATRDHRVEWSGSR